MEVPTPIQDTMKFYIDWDMRLSRLSCITGTLLERVVQARTLALETPCIICRILQDNGWLDENDCVQVVVKEVISLCQ